MSPDRKSASGNGCPSSWNSTSPSTTPSQSFYDTLADEATDLRYHRLYDLIDRLDDDDERKLLFLYLDRKRLREIAEITGTTETAVKQKLYRIKQKLNDLKTAEDE